KVADKVLAVGVDRLIGIGGAHTLRMIGTVREGSGHATEADSTIPLAQHVNTLLQPHDVVLVKGANALGLEATARELAGMCTTR
ncbi:hypothetical protein HRW08_36565, partial [Streptomyces lunaelactis]|nr:hypothetical protein [Streptomyces lunaelactis]